MYNKKITIDEKKAFSPTLARFKQTCGLKPDSDKHRRMLEKGMKVREDGIDGIHIKALVSFFSGEAFTESGVKAGGNTLWCNYFEKLPKGSVKGIYFYMLTAGECYFSSEENIMDFLYADIWGTSYVDAGIEILREEYIKSDLKKRFKGESAFLSEEFGPGYFGMPVIESKKFFSILNGEEIGIRVKESGLMIPQKSCTGFYLVLSDESIKAEPECVSCMGNPSGCSFCGVRSQKQGENI